MVEVRSEGIRTRRRTEGTRSVDDNSLGVSEANGERGDGGREVRGETSIDSFIGKLQLKKGKSLPSHSTAPLSKVLRRLELMLMRYAPSLLFPAHLSLLSHLLKH